MTATHTLQTTNSRAVLSLAFELGWTEWKLGFSTGIAGAPRLHTIRARDLGALGEEIARAKKRFGLPEDTVLYSCYEAGRDGFWLHRYLTAHGIHNVDCRLREYRGQTPRASDQDRPARRRQIAHHADPPLPRVSRRSGVWCTCPVSWTKTGGTYTATWRR